jgi:hypothetical protein
MKETGEIVRLSGIMRKGSSPSPQLASVFLRRIPRKV